MEYVQTYNCQIYMYKGSPILKFKKNLMLFLSGFGATGEWVLKYALKNNFLVELTNASF